MTGKCFICNRESECQTYEREGRIEWFFSCPHCGNYVIPNKSFIERQYGEQEDDVKYLVSCYLFNENRNKKSCVRIDLKTIERILHSIPGTIVERVNALLTYLDSKTTFFGKPLLITKEIIYSYVDDELYNIFDALEKRELIKDEQSTDRDLRCSLTMKGIEYLNKQTKKNNSDTCFVAMWFSDDMNSVFEECIIPACLKAGYKPIRVDFEQYNDDITDKIISLIKTTSFTIADFSGYRGGVYYEAGFARGLGKEVIYTCEDTWFEGKPEDNRKVHFDVNHQNFIEWNRENLSDFMDKLFNRIVATIGMGTYKEPVVD